MADPKATTVANRPIESASESATVKPLQPLQPGDLDDLETTNPGSRYQLRRALGEGGMGEVALCHDARIGREVARKSIHPAMARRENLERFMREARVQGQLEHPSVVPVYDIDYAADGTPFFTMKCVRGLTLADLIEGLAMGNGELAARFGLRRLLSAFSQLCLAVDYAHSRGVLHRDLKPSNVMLGEFGELHVLDWGLARVIGARDGVTIPQRASAPEATQLGTVMGTPGYMSPEQARGETDALGPSSDVYALGGILYYLLTFEPLYVGSTLERVEHTARGMVDVAERIGQSPRPVPPELETAVIRATAFAPADRFVSARALSEAVERYLDGDRDQQRRAQLATEHLERARAHLASTQADARADAMRELSRALALEPERPDAVALLQGLLTTTPTELPDEARAEMEHAQAQARSRTAKAAAIRYASWLAVVPVVWLMGVRSWPIAGATLVAMAASLVLAIALRRAGAVGERSSIALLLISSFALACLTSLFGPFIVVPGLAATNTLYFATHIEGRSRRFAYAVGLAVVLVPALLEVLGVVSPAYAFSGGNIEVLPRMTDFPATATSAMLLIANVALTLTPALLMGRMRDELSRAERQLFLHSWHLKKLGPSPAPRAP